MAGEVQKVNVVNVNNYARTLSPEEVKKRQENEKFFENVKGQMKDAGLTLEHAEDKGLNKESKKLLATYGLEKEAAESVGINKVQLEEKDGVKKLVLISSPELYNYKLSIYIDKNYDPDKIELHPIEAGATLRFGGINGEIEILGIGELYNGYGYSKGEYPGNASTLMWFRNCNIKIRCADGVEDSFILEKNVKAEITTGDYADFVEVIQDADTGKGFKKRLKPGTESFKTGPYDPYEEWLKEMEEMKKKNKQ